MTFFRKPRRASALPKEEHFLLTIDGADIRVRLRRDARARRFTLRLPASGGDPVVTLPADGCSRAARNFAERERHWLAARLKRRPDSVAFEEGALVPLRGIEHRIVSGGRHRGTVRREDGDLGPRLVVFGAAEHLSRRLTDWLKREARADIEAAVADHAARLKVTPGRVTLRDTTTRWGSCSSSGALSFSWRLVLAPPEVLDYVAAHEVAHLKEMNHSPRFWRHVETLCPGMEEPRAWLRSNGPRLHAYGAGG
ncbi:hypothetical protein GGD81_000962 [Rhodobium orientis]|uniref:Zinc metallopeptidase n=1 Tax=Rhodobium orientis TaxID=34017 RepID=A0A327JQU8_9HYPH|nr:SprT family zinc-dependent metalloprotease [Rhodobium orientis]MBB4301938.1 hypothetical protein [Rhodobium orientis]MBK5950175.1 zinc metallopeptidase [Rhodobium orientis]RAI27242.1 zinc metallopeptidase [Rhodobium orientis]